MHYKSLIVADLLSEIIDIGIHEGGPVSGTFDGTRLDYSDMDKFNGCNVDEVLQLLRPGIEWFIANYNGDTTSDVARLTLDKIHTTACYCD